jgi:DNA repair exonuclease SbcCD ATPase subunit
MASNGSAKTSLVMSILWALTGSLDPRPVQDSKVADVVNDASKVSIP